MQTLTFSSHVRPGRLPDSSPPKRLRTLRFLSERYARRERTGVAAEFLLFAVIAVTAIWPMFTLAHALALHR